MWNKIINSKLFYAILAAICAVVCWVYVDIVEAPSVAKTIYNISVEFVGEDMLAEQGLMITEGKDTTVNLTLSGARSVLSQLDRSNITITVQAASQISGEGEYSLNYSVSYPGNTGSKVTVTSSSVSTIDVTVVQMTSKTVDIEGVFEGSVVEDALIDESAFQFETTTVTVSGERSLVEQVDHAVVTLAEENLDDTWSGELDIELVDADGNVLDMTDLSCSITSVYTTFPVMFMKEVPLTVEFTDGGGATADDVDYSISPSDTIVISGTQEVLDGIDSILLGTIDLSKIVTTDVLSFNISVPDGVTIESGITSASVTVTVVGLTTRTVETTNIQFVNVPDGITVEAVTQSLVVRIRGAADVMELVLDSDVTVTVDLSDYDETDTGTRKLTATVSVSGFADVGAIGDYQIVASITQS